MLVEAIKAGFHAGARRRVGDRFEVPDSFKATWVIPVGEIKPAAKATKPEKVPRTLSEMGKQGVTGPTDLA